MTTVLDEDRVLHKVTLDNETVVSALEFNLFRRLFDREWLQWQCVARTWTRRRDNYLYFYQHELPVVGIHHYSRRATLYGVPAVYEACLSDHPAAFM